MPPIRQYSAQIQEGGIPQSRPVQSTDIYDPSGVKKLNKAVDTTEDLVKKADERNQTISAEKRYSETYLQAQQEILKLRETATGDEDLTGQTLEIYDKYAKSIQDDETLSDFQKRYLDSKFTANRDNIGSASLTYEAQLKAKKRLVDFDAKVDAAQNIILSDPSQLKSQIADLEATLGLVPMTGPAKTEVEKKMREQIAASYIGAIAQTNPAQAKKELQGKLMESMMSPDARLAAMDRMDGKIEALQRKAQADLQMQILDPAGWGEKHGLGVDQIAQMQANPATASVVSDKKAKMVIKQMTAIDNTDGVIAFAQEVRDTYGEYTPNAVRDLMKGGMPPAHAAMMQMALDDPVAYNEQIDLMLQAGKAGDKELNEAYKTKVFTYGFDGQADPSEIEESVSKDVSDMVDTLYQEGYGFDEINENLRLTTNLAKSYRIKHPSASEDDAVKFATSYFNSKYRFAELNGVKYRIPATDPYGGVYDADDIEGRIEDHYGKMEFYTGDTKASEKLKEVARPFLNPTKTGVRFRAPDGEVLLNKDGGIAELLFEDVVKQETPEERKQRLINMSFGTEAQRKAARESR